MTDRERLPIWGIGCSGIDAVLWTSFEWDELLNLDAFFVRVKNGHAKRALANETLEHCVFAVAHKMCHWENPVSSKIQRYLEVMHSKAMEETEEIKVSDDLSKCAGIICGEGKQEDLPGTLWSLLSDSREKVRSCGYLLVQRVALKAMKSWLALGYEGVRL